MCARVCVYRHVSTVQHNLDGLERALREEFTACPPLFSKPEGLETANPTPGSVVPRASQLVSA